MVVRFQAAHRWDNQSTREFLNWWLCPERLPRKSLGNIWGESLFHNLQKVFCHLMTFPKLCSFSFLILLKVIILFRVHLITDKIKIHWETNARILERFRKKKWLISFHSYNLSKGIWSILHCVYNLNKAICKLNSSPWGERPGSVSW